jgi:hypothetical protein
MPRACRASVRCWSQRWKLGWCGRRRWRRSPARRGCGRPSGRPRCGRPRGRRRRRRPGSGCTGCRAPRPSRGSAARGRPGSGSGLVGPGVDDGAVEVGERQRHRFAAQDVLVQLVAGGADRLLEHHHQRAVALGAVVRRAAAAGQEARLPVQLPLAALASWRGRSRGRSRPPARASAHVAQALMELVRRVVAVDAQHHAAVLVEQQHGRGVLHAEGRGEGLLGGRGRRRCR